VHLTLFDMCGRRRAKCALLSLLLLLDCVVVILPEGSSIVSLLCSRSGHVSWFAIAVTKRAGVVIEAGGELIRLGYVLVIWSVDLTVASNFRGL
jgi:hypothetical protein